MSDEPPTSASEQRDPAASLYEPEAYWSDRLRRHDSLRGTGHLAYSEGYNAWLYRAKARALRRALEGVPSGARALDVGSGTGWVIGQLRDRGLAVEGCDIAPEAVERLRARHPGVQLFVAALGAEPLPRPDAAYDLVTALDVAYHVVDDAAWASGVRELGRLVRPGGRIVVTDELGDADRAPAPHVRFRSEAHWGAAAADAGLKVERLIPMFRWLSRDPDAAPLLRHLPHRARGAVEYGLELTVPRRAHLVCAVLGPV